MGRFYRGLSVLSGIFVWSMVFLRTTDGRSITWYNPPPSEIVTDPTVVSKTSKNLTKGSLNEELSCEFNLTADLSIVIVTMGIGVNTLASYAPSTGVVAPLFEGRGNATWIPTKLTLIVFNVTTTDAGIYSCKVFTAAGTWTREIHVNIQEVPKIIEVSGFTEREGGNMTLKCLAKGKPTPNITWTRLSDGRDITWTRLPDGSVISRTLLNITRQNAGAGYRCTATNGAGNPDIRDVNIDVQYKPDHVSLNVSTNEVCAGTEVLFTCSAGAANPAILNYSLHDKNSTGTVKTSSNQGGVFPLTVTMKGQHIYTCGAANSVGNTVSSSSAVEVQVPASVTIENDTIVVLEGGNATLRCVFSGFPSPNVSWINNSLSYTEDTESILKLSNITRYSDAVYTCSASNACGNENKTVKIDVQYPVEATGRGTEDSVDEGGKKIFSCPVRGNPKPNIKWYKGFEASGNPVSNETLLTVENVKESACYTCFASNSRGTPVNISHCLIVNTTSAPSITTPSNESEVSAGPPWVIIVAVTGGVVVLLIVVGVLTWWVHKQRKCRKDSKSKDQMLLASRRSHESRQQSCLCWPTYKRVISNV